MPILTVEIDTGDVPHAEIFKATAIRMGWESHVPSDEPGELVPNPETAEDVFKRYLKDQLAKVVTEYRQRLEMQRREQLARDVAQNVSKVEFS